MDNHEHKIIKHLLEDGRISIRSLAEEIGLKPNKVQSKIMHLQEKKVIRSYSISLNPEKLGITRNTLHIIKMDSKNYKEPLLIQSFLSEWLEQILREEPHVMFAGTGFKNVIAEKKENNIINKKIGKHNPRDNNRSNITSSKNKINKANSFHNINEKTIKETKIDRTAMDKLKTKKLSGHVVLISSFSTIEEEREFIKRLKSYPFILSISHIPFNMINHANERLIEFHPNLKINDHFS